MITKLLLTVMFLISGVYKLYDPSLSIQKLTNVLPQYKSYIANIIALAGVWEVVASALVLFGTRYYAKQAVLSLIVFTVVATLLFHYPPQGMKYYPFISNVTTVGGLYLLYQTL